MVSELTRAKHEMGMKMSQSLSELDQSVLERKRLEGECEHLKREVRATKETNQRTQRAMQEALELKTRLAEEVQRENKRLIDEREYEIQKITELKEDELEKLQNAIKTQYAPAKSKAVDEVFSASERLEKSADALSQRVQEHLGGDEYMSWQKSTPR